MEGVGSYGAFLPAADALAASVTLVPFNIIISLYLVFHGWHWFASAAILVIK